MSIAGVVELRKPPADAAEATVDGLLEQRAELEAELSRLAAVGRTQAEAEARLASLAGEEAAINAAEAAAWDHWAAAPDKPLPEPLSRRREALEAQRRLAANDCQAAVRAGQALKPKIDALTAKLQATNDAIFSLRLKDALAEAVETNAKVHQTVETLREHVVRVYGLDDALTKLNAQYQFHAAKSEAICQVRIEFDKLKQPPFSYNQSDIAVYGEAWLRKLVP
jgi:hypothetical protein